MKNQIRNLKHLWTIQEKSHRMEMIGLDRNMHDMFKFDVFFPS